MDATGVIAAIETNLVTNLRLFASWASIPATSSAPVQSCRPLDVGITERVGQTVTPHRAGLAYGFRRALVAKLCGKKRSVGMLQEARCAIQAGRAGPSISLKLI